MPEYDFIKAAHCQNHSRVPIWIMRQAGRYLPRYRTMREDVSFEQLCMSPEMVTDITIHPIDVFGFDAAILFSDILLPLEPFGIKVTYDNGGPRLGPPIRHPDDVIHLKTFNPAEKMAPVLDAIREIKRRLNETVPLIGFCGAPFTLAGYMIEGGGSWSLSETKRFLYNHPQAATTLLNRIADVTGQYLKEQIKAGVDAVQLFDSWGGILSPEAYQRFSLPYIKTVFEMCRTENIPRILYMNNSQPYLRYLAELNCEVVSIDWRTNLPEAMAVLTGKAIQGNLDPHLLFAPPELIYQEATRILETCAKTDGFIFNLGHGILPETPIESVRLLVDTVHSFVGNK